MMRFLPPAAGDMRFLTPTRPVLCFWWKSSASMYQLPTDTFCTGAYFFDRRSRPFRRIRTVSLLLAHANASGVAGAGGSHCVLGPLFGLSRRGYLLVPGPFVSVPPSPEILEFGLKPHA